MPLSHARKNAIKDWLVYSRGDLQSAKLLYENKIYSTGLYHLQQSNEKLAKALLISIGFLTPKKATENSIVHDFIGFIPKEPAAYNHRILKSLLSDIERTYPAVDEYLQIIKESTFGLRVPSFEIMIKNSKKGVQKLKKKPGGPITSSDQMAQEVRAVQNIIGALDKLEEELEKNFLKLDYPTTVNTIKSNFEKSGLTVSAEDIPSLESIKARTMESAQRSMIAMLSVGVASLLDPLEAITRYPDLQKRVFDINSPYVIHFQGLYSSIEQILEKSMLMFELC